MIVSAFYNSSQAQSVVAAQIVRSAYPDATFYDTNGLNTASITTVIGTISASSQNRIFALVDVGTNPPAGNLTAGQITALDGKLNASDPRSDAATINTNATGTANTTKLRTTLTWESVYPGQPIALLAQILGQNNYIVELLDSTATAGAATTITDSAAVFPVDGLKGKWLRITGGTGEGQVYQILTNSATVITIDGTFATTPDNTSEYDVFIYVNNQSVIETGTATGAGSGLNTLEDTGATWTVDEWIGSSLRITGGTGSGQELLIVDNTATELTVVRDWTTPPDNTSVYAIVQYTAKGGSNVTVVETTTATSGAASSITDSTAAYPVNLYQGLTVEIVGGTGAGQQRSIASNTATVITTSQAWAVTPDATSEFIVYKPGDAWQYNLADVFAELAIESEYTDLSDNAQTFRLILGKPTEAEALVVGRNQDLRALNAILEKGETIYNYLYL